MDSLSPNPAPGILLTDNYKVVEAFNKALEEDPTLLITDIALILQARFNDTILYLTNNDAQFVSMEYQFMLNGAPKLSLELFETDEFFEVKLLRSAVTNAVAEFNKDVLPPNIKPPSTVFYIAFGLGTDISYWSNFNSYSLAAAETFEDFGQAKKVTLTFVASLGLHEFSLQTLASFLNPSILQNGYISVFEQFKLSDEEKSNEDLYPVTPRGSQAKYTLARREYRKDNFPFYKAALDNLVDKCLQVFFNTDNVLLLTPTSKVNDYMTQLQSKYNQRTELGDLFNTKQPEPIQQTIEEAYREYRKAPEQVKIPKDYLTNPNKQLPNSRAPEPGKLRATYTKEEENHVQQNIKNNVEIFKNQFSQANSTSDVIRAVANGLAKLGENTPKEVWFFALTDFFKLFKANLCNLRRDSNYTTPNVGMLSSKEEFNIFLISPYFAQLGITLNSSTADTESIKALLDNFINGYNQIAGNQETILVRENDIEILTALDLDIKNKYGKSFFNPNKPLVIFGLRELIGNYIYGQDYKIVDNILDIDKENIKKTVDSKLNKVFNLYNSQNVDESSILQNLIAQDDQRRSRFNDLLKKKNLPIFKYNYQNSNVISVTVNDNKSYFNLLNQSYAKLKDYGSLKTLLSQDPELAVESLEEREIKKALEDKDLDPVLYDILEGRVADFGNLMKQVSNIRVLAVTEPIKKKYAKLKSDIFATKLRNASPEDQIELILSMDEKEVFSDDMLYGFLKEGTFDEADIKPLFLTSSVEAYENKIKTIKNLLDTDKIEEKVKTFYSYLNKEYGLVSKVEDSYANDPLKFFIDQMDTLDKAVYQLEIETLPYFPISNALYINTPCLLFAVRPSFIGNNRIRNPLDSISGGYNITGYYHKIDANRAYSKFKLFRVTKE